jgi:uncharacterized protein
MPKQTRPKSPKARAAGWRGPLRPQQPLISGKWLLCSIGIIVALAAICVYGALCLLSYQGGWQIIFHPSRSVDNHPSIPYQEIHFNYTETGQPQLTGWWIPAAPNAHHHANTILFLHGGSGSLSNTIPELESLYTAGINIFAFDYRGFGKSARLHPSETSLNQDADAALSYLTDTRHLPANSIVLYGTGLGASVAATRAARQPGIPVLILENISPDAMTLFAADDRTRILPVRLLTSDRFEINSILKTLATPKLFLASDNTPQTQAAFNAAQAPKQFAQIPSDDRAKYVESIEGFLGEVLTSTVAKNNR